jgi:hypothetical protein
MHRRSATGLNGLRPKRAWPLALAAALALSGGAAVQAQAPAQTAAQTQGEKPTPVDAAAHAKAQAEAPAEARKVWDALLRTCGASAFVSLNGGAAVFELKGASFELTPVAMPEEEKLNGYAFQGTAVAKAAQWRLYRWDPARKARSWTAWKPGEDLEVQVGSFTKPRSRITLTDTVLHFALVKRNGRWSPDEPVSPATAALRPFDLSTLEAHPFMLPAATQSAAAAASAYTGPTAPPTCEQARRLR